MKELPDLALVIFDDYRAGDNHHPQYAAFGGPEIHTPIPIVVVYAGIEPQRHGRTRVVEPIERKVSSLEGSRVLKPTLVTEFCGRFVEYNTKAFRKKSTRELVREVVPLRDELPRDPDQH